MIDSDEFSQLLVLIEQTKSISDIKGFFAYLVDFLSLSNIVYHALNLPFHEENAVLIPTYDPEWVKLYIERDYFRIDPVVTFGKRGFLPIDWSSVDRETNSAQSFFREADRFGVGRTGVSIPIRGPNGEQALFTATTNIDARDWEVERADRIRDFQLIGSYVHDKIARLVGLRDGPEPIAELSRRERQCLKAVSSGLAPKQIAAKLDVSTAAIHLYLQSARQKLACTTLPQAALRAKTMDLI